MVSLFTASANLLDVMKHNASTQHEQGIQNLELMWGPINLGI